MVFLIICLFYMGQILSQPNSDSVSEIQSFLEKTEQMKLTNNPQFLKNLSILNKKNNLLSNNQMCFYQYLKSYQITYKGQFDIGKKKIIGLLNECKDNNSYIRLNGLLANVSAISGDYSQAIVRLNDILPLLDEINLKQLKFQIYQTAFTVYRLVNQAELSIKFSELMIKDNPPKYLLCKAKVNANLSTFKINDKFISDEEVQETIDLCIESKQTVYAQLLLIYWLAEKMQETDSQIVYLKLLEQLKSNDEILESTGFKNIIGIKNSLKAQLYEKLDQLELAKTYAQNAIDGSISIGETAQKIKALDVLVNYYQKQGNYKKANEHLIDKSRSEKKYNTNEQAKFMAFQTVKHDKLADTYKIKSLSQENKLLQLKNKLAEKSKINQQLLNILYGIVAFFFAIFAYRLIKQQRKFKRLSEYDHMTLVFNRKGIKDYMSDALSDAEKNEEIIGYVIFDLDLFKRVNDVYGHIVGDWVIKQSIKACINLNNAKVTFARLGGEEFSIILRNSNLDEIKEFSEQCRAVISNIETMEGTGYDFQISASFGITTTDISGYDYTNLMTHADHALYYSKENGRNQVTVFRQQHLK